MTDKIRAIDADHTIADAAKAMKADDIGFLPIVSAEKKVVGVLSDRDIVLRAIAADVDPKTTKASDIATKGAVWCRTDDTVEKASNLMADKKIRRLLVVDTDNQPAGTLSLGDVAVEAEPKTLAAEVLAEVSKG
jgi:CBS domain-containing protein